MKKNEINKKPSIKLSNIYISNLIHENEKENYKMTRNYKVVSRFKKILWLNRQERYEQKINSLGRKKYRR